VGRLLEDRGHYVTFGNRALPRGSADQIVCVAAMKDGAILIAADHDMKTIAKLNGLESGRFKSLSLVKLSCRKPEAAMKVTMALSVIEHEWECHVAQKQRRLWIEIQHDVIRIRREFSPNGGT